MPEKPTLPEDGSNLDSQPTQPYLPPEMEDSQATRLQSPENRTRNMPPVKDERLVQPPPRASYNRTRTAPEKPKRGTPPPTYEAPRVPVSRPTPQPRSNPLSLPIWSVLLMLFMVCGGVSCLVVAVFGLGGRTAPALPPQFVVITAAPTETPAITIPALSAQATAPIGLPGQQAGASAVILAGPTLAPIVISPTPETIGVGKAVIVDSKESGLNVRSAPGVTTGSSVLFVVDDGAIFDVVDGPAQADGYTWWKIQNPNDPTQSGWAASVFLEIAPNPQS